MNFNHLSFVILTAIAWLVGKEATTDSVLVCEKFLELNLNPSLWGKKNNFGVFVKILKKLKIIFRYFFEG